MKTLVVEDELASQELLKVILEPMGHVDIAADGVEALRMFNTALGGEPYDLICLDIVLPRMDGQKVLESIRAIETQRGVLGPDGVKIIMITARSDFESIQKAFASLATSYITKPIRQEKLLAELKKLGL